MNLPGRDRHVSCADVCIIPFPVVRCKLSSMNAAKYSWHCTKTVDKYSYNSQRSDGVLPSQQSHMELFEDYVIDAIDHECEIICICNHFSLFLQFYEFSEYCFLVLIKLYT